MTGQPRFAVYFAPEDDTPLAHWGWSWLGRQPRTTVYGPLPPDRADLVADARHYGFHATLKAPFRLGGQVDEAALRAAMTVFAARRRPFDLPLGLQDLHGFLALRPVRDLAELDALAADCVRAFDRFRAPLDEAERRKRLAVSLTGRQRRHVDGWGYPYVFDDFRFHMTLTRRLDDGERAAVIATLAPVLTPVLAEPVAVRSVCLFRQDEGGPFVLAERYPFTG